MTMTNINNALKYEEVDAPLVRFCVGSRKLSNVGQSLDGWLKIYYLELLRASEGTLSRLPFEFAVVSIHSSFNEGWRQAVDRS
jgi:hypothetical protein